MASSDTADNPPSKETACLSAARAFKDEGNALFGNGQIGKAMRKYHVALIQVKGVERLGSLGSNVLIASIVPGAEDVDKDTLHHLAKLKRQADISIRLPCYNNLSACMLKLEDWPKAISFASQALALDVDNVKALFRRGQAYYFDRDFGRAKQDLQTVLGLDPDNKAAQQHLAMVEVQLSEGEKKERKMCQAMFGS
eukprot:scpid95480/ scgid24997/ Tetratricopeptide repeat protein 9C